MAKSNLSGRCKCGCGKKTNIARQDAPERGIFKGLPNHFINGHQRRLSPHEYLVDGKTGCWIWQRSLGPSGYGRIWKGGKSQAAHRWYWEQKYGSIPDGKELDHKCHSEDKSCPGNECIHRRCVNPEHLEPVTHFQNMQRGRSARLSEKQVQEIRSLCEQGWLHKDIAPAYGISAGWVCEIQDGRAWL